MDIECLIQYNGPLTDTTDMHDNYGTHAKMNDDFWNAVIKWT